MAGDSAPPGTPRVTDLIVVGASAGGIDALTSLLSAVPVGLPAPIVVAQHLEPSRVSHLAQILASRTGLAVRTVVDLEPLAAGVLYVVPANRDVEITDHSISLRAGTQGRPKPSIDLLLSTAAQIFGERLIAVILSGTGSDGTEGARRVKEAGGTVIIQNPETARFPGMPLSLPPSTVDIVAEAESIGPLLQDLLTGAYSAPSPAEDRRMRALLDQIRARSGIDFSLYRQPTIRRRLQRRMADVGADSIDEYIGYLQRHPEEYRRLTSSFLIKVTDFFRDEELFLALRERILPELIAEARTRGNELRLWSAGCATGEEAYSLAVLVAELLGPAIEELSVRVFATDIDPDAVAYARRGIYPSAALENVPADLRARYFSPTDGGEEVKRSVRRLVVFAAHDLGQRPPFPRIDLALCRNVLIYFTPDLQRRALQLFAFSLRAGGRLILGKSETTSPLPDYFSIEDARLKVYQRQNDRVLMPLAEFKEASPPLGSLAPSRPEIARIETGASRLSASYQTPRTRMENAERLLLDLPVGVVVVDRRFDIQAINAAARQLLSIHSPAIDEDLIHLARRVPAEPLRSLIDRAFEGRASTERIEAQTLDAPPGERRLLEVRCFPQQDPATGVAVGRAVLLVSDVTPAQAEPGAAAPAQPPERAVVADALDELGAYVGGSPDVGEGDRIVGIVRPALEAALGGLERLTGHIRDLEEVRRELLAANRDLTAANAELRGQNEELLLANEEAQAAMEEVETLSEEQQASNEELETLNEELQATVEELNTTNDDLEARGLELQEAALSLESERSRLAAILASMADGVLVVDRTGRVLQTNAAFERMFPGGPAMLRPESEAGRPLAPDAWPQRRATAGETFTTEFFQTFADGSRRRFEAIGRPILHDGEESAVLVIRDVTERDPESGTTAH